MKVTILGCGTSSGVPRIGPDWGDCNPDEPRNRRTRASILIETLKTRILVDTGPDLRHQLLANAISAVDAVIWTHDHADHTHGIDDLRQLFHAQGEAIPGYAKDYTIKALKNRFGYVFEGNRGYPATCEITEIADRTEVGDMVVSTIDLPHGPVLTTGMKFEHGERTIGYATDFSALNDEALGFFSGLDLWVVDALRRKPHPTHPHLALTLNAIERCKPTRAVLTHMDQSMDYRELARHLPDGVEPGYDGQVIER